MVWRPASATLSPRSLRNRRLQACLPDRTQPKFYSHGKSMPMILKCRYATVALLAALWALPPASDAARAAERLRVGVSIPAAIAFVPLQVGIEQGIFKKHDIDVERSDLGGAARAHQALAAGSLDLVVAGGPDLALVAKGRHALAVGVITK